MRVLFFKQFNKIFLKNYSTKNNSERFIKIENYYEFMDQNIQTKQKLFENKIVDDENVLLSIVKCPMTNSLLESSEEGLKIAHIIYPKKNGIYYLNEEDVIFKF